jgi:DNA-binding MarR family transcriptional regulator
METTTASQLYNALSRLGRQIHRMEHRAVHRGVRGCFKMYRGQTHLLALLSQKNGASQRDLAEEMDVRPSSMTEMLLRMEAAGLITRKQDESDQRIMRIFLTEAGEEAVRQSSGAAIDLAAALFDCLTAEEQAQMLALTEKLNANLGVLDRPWMPGGRHHGFHHGHVWHHLRRFPNPFGPRGNDGRAQDDL